MRPGLVLALACVLALAGCAKKSEDPTPTPGTQASTGSGSAGASSGSSPPPSQPSTQQPTPTTSTPSSSTSATAPGPSGYWPHDFGAAPSTQTIQVPANAAPVDIIMGFYTIPSMSGTCDNGDVAIALDGPSGSGVRLALDIGTKCATAKNWTNQQMAVGTWTLHFDGQGSGTGYVTIGPHGNKTQGGPVQVREKRTHDHQNAPETLKVAIPANALPGHILLQITGEFASEGCVSPDASVVVTAPNGTRVAALAVATPPPLPQTCPAPKRVDGVAFAEGDWKVAFDGTGSAFTTVEFASD